MGYVLVQPSEAETKTLSGIILPESAQEKPAQGKVISVGEDLILESGKVMTCPVKVGETVVYKKWGGSEYKEFLIVEDKDILSVIS